MCCAAVDRQILPVVPASLSCGSLMAHSVCIPAVQIEGATEVSDMHAAAHVSHRQCNITAQRTTFIPLSSSVCLCRNSSCLCFVKSGLPLCQLLYEHASNDKYRSFRGCCIAYQKAARHFIFLERAALLSCTHVERISFCFSNLEADIYTETMYEHLVCTFVQQFFL